MELARQGYVLRGSLGLHPPGYFFAQYNFQCICSTLMNPATLMARRTSYFVLGGVAVFEREVYWINEQVNAIAAKYFPHTEIEFHTQAIASHREEPWHSCPTEQRNQIIDELCNTISSRHVTLFGIAIEKATASNPIARAFEEICNRCDLFLRRLHAHGDTQRGLIIFDESRYENSL